MLAVMLAVMAPLVATQQGTGGVLYVGGLFDHRVTDRYQFEFVAQLINNKTDGFYDELLADLALETRVVDSGCSATMATTALWSMARDWG